MCSELVNNLDNNNMCIVSGLGLEYDSIFNICLSLLCYIKVKKHILLVKRLFGPICILESLVGHYVRKFEDNSRLQVIISIKLQVKKEKEKINTLARGATMLGRGK